jgi:hypothetical protein
MDKQRTYPFLPDDKCLTEQQLFDYIDGKLSDPEMHRAEKHLLDCDMCSDALEGFEKIKHRDKVTSYPPNKIPEKAAQEIAKDDEPNEPKIIPIRSNRRSLYAIAAAVVLILGITVVMRMNLSQDQPASKLAEQTTNVNPVLVSPEKQNTRTVDSAANNTNVAAVKSPEAKIDPNRSLASGGNQGADIKYEVDKSTTAGVVTDADIPSSPQQTNEDKFDLAHSMVIPDADANNDSSINQISMDDKMQQSDEAVNSGISSDRMENQQPTNTKAVSAKDNKKDQSEYYSQKNKDSSGKVAQRAPVNTGPAAQTQTTGGVYNAPAPTSNNGAAVNTDAISVDTSSEGNVLNERPSEEQVNLDYATGVKLLDAGQVNASLPYFDEVLQNPKNKNFEDAQWKKSIALIQLNRKDEAKVLLNEIVKKNGKYMKQAQDKLKTL